MKTKLIPAAIGLLALAATGLAQADYGKPYFEARQDRQMHRIERGIENGSLTRDEAKALKKQQRHIRRTHREFLDDGRLGRKERKALERKFDRASDEIKHLAHNKHYRKYRRHGHRDHIARGHGHGHKHGHKRYRKHHYGKHHYGKHRYGKRHDYGHRYGHRDRYRHYDDHWWFGFGFWN